MRFLDPLDDLLSSRAKVRILRYLALRPGEHSGREIARSVRMGETPTNRALKSLADTLVVVFRSDSRTHWYRLNDGYALVQEVLLPLFRAESAQLARAVASLLHGFEQGIHCALVYGSAARGDECWNSDLDLLVIVPARGQVEPLRQALVERDQQFLRRYGVTSPQVLDAQDVLRRLANDEAWLQEALREGVILLGDLPVELRRERAA